MALDIALEQGLMAFLKGHKVNSLSLGGNSISYLKFFFIAPKVATGNAYESNRSLFTVYCQTTKHSA